MCWVGIVAQVGAQALAMRQQYKSQAKMLEAQAMGATKEMNYAFQNYEQERQDSFDAAVNDITKTRINQMQLNSQVNAAIAEGYTGGGRTANRLMRAAEADTSRTVASIQDNYTRKSNEVDLNKEATLLSTKDYINNLIEQGKISKTQKFADILGLANTALGATANTGLLDRLLKTKAVVGISGKGLLLNQTIMLPLGLLWPLRS